MSTAVNHSSFSTFIWLARSVLFCDSIFKERYNIYFNSCSKRIGLLNMSETPQLGGFVRLLPLTIDDLPEHPSLPGPGVLGKSPPSEQTSHQQAQKSSTQGSSRRPPLEFINSVLTEALTFADSTLDATFKPLSEKSASGSTAKVKLLKGEFSSEQTNAGLQSASSLRSTTTTKAPAETWFARRSRHENALRQGTATWDEFDHYLRDDHSETEKAYTPDIKYSHTALDWDPELKGKNVSNFSDIKMHSEFFLHPGWTRRIGFKTLHVSSSCFLALIFPNVHNEFCISITCVL